MTPQAIAGLKSRTVIAIGRAMPKRLLLKLIGDEWHEELQMSVYEAMKRLERDVVRRTLKNAAVVAARPYSNAVGALGADEPQAVGSKIARAIRGLDRPSKKKAR